MFNAEDCDLIRLLQATLFDNGVSPTAICRITPKVYCVLSVALSQPFCQLLYHKQIHEASCMCTSITCLMLMWMTQRMLRQQLEHQEHIAGPPCGPG